MKKKREKKKSSAVGMKIRSARLASGMSQMRLAEKIGISYQQLQKYENGTSDLSVSRLLQFSHVLNLPISHLLDQRPDLSVSEPRISYGELTPEEVKLITVLRKINNRNFTLKLIDTFKSLLDFKKK